MTVLQVADLRFGYAGDTLFEGVTFTLALGEHASLVAPNGAGKSTLLRLLAKEIEPDAGEVVVKKDVTVGYYRQSHEVAAKGDVLSAFLSGFRDVVELREELVRAQHDAASGDARALEHLAHVTDRYHVARGDELEHRVAAIAAKLGFSNEDLARPVTSLSGGERGRLHLGVILAQEPDLLMLDEPTNHLDLDTIAWLEGWLKGYRGAVLVVSHDRAFLDAVAPNTMELGTRGLRVYPLAYSAYAEAREEDLARERAILERQQAFVAKTEDFIRKNIAGQKSKQAQSRRKMLDKLERVERPEDVWAVAERIAFRFAPAPRSGDIVLEATGLNARRGGRGLFEGVDLLVRRGERIGIVGPNGAGKSTLLKVLAGRGDPELDGGSVRRGTNLREGYFDQHLGQVDPKKSAVEEVRSVRGDFTVEAARQYLARFRFWGDDPLRVVAGFSGGERSRLALAKLLLEPKNLLFLDEPTNHLDIPAAEILEEALASFDGTVVLVSHDRRFLETVTTRIVSVRDGNVDLYPGGFSDFVAVQRAREQREREEAQPRRAESKKPPPAKAQGTASSDPAAKKGQHQAQKQASRDREKQQRRVKDLEELIAAGEKQLAELRAALREDPAGNWEKLAKMASEERALARRVDSLVDEWTKLSALVGS